MQERGYSVELGEDGEAGFTNQYGIAIPNVPRSPPSDRDALRDQHRRLRLLIDSNTCKNGSGDRMQLWLGVLAISNATGLA